ncbi:MAG: Abi family protein [Lachnospiraceae bacterium]|nr:Abi family protein [Lachnospiraceae bacterium]
MEQRKPKLTNKEMISHLRNRGITFDLMSEREAFLLLRQSTYLYRITAYRKNFKKQYNIYQNLDFAMLVDLEVIDTKLRYLLLEMSLDYEYAIKSKLLDLITSDPNENGYDIVYRFRLSHPNTFKIVMKNFGNSTYLKDMYIKRKNDIAIWTLLEVMNFGQISILIDFMWKEKSIKSLREAQRLHKFAKNIRNAAAHNSPLFVNLFSKSTCIKNNQFIVSFAAGSQLSYDELSEQKLNDIFSLFYLHKRYCDKSLVERRVAYLRCIIERWERHTEWYLGIERLEKFKSAFEKLVDFYARNQ